MRNVDAVLFGKYQLCRILGTGRTGTVFLAVHLGLEEYRAVKQVSKSFLDYERFRREALILKELRHPGIPIVYDLEEDESYSYLIEEYLEGDSLFDLVKKQGHLPRGLAIHYGIQLTRIINYLHVAGEKPILHLDLQPKNLLLCQDAVKLIDFDRAAPLKEANAPGERYGTVGFAAPEQYLKDGVLDERTDIYAVGVILSYMTTGKLPGPSDQTASFEEGSLGWVISRCMETDKEKRFVSAQELEEQLKKLEDRTMAAAGRLQSSSLTIAFTGSKSGSGTTHAAVGLSVYLRNHGYPNLFEEKNDSGMGRELGLSTAAKRDGFGIMRFGSFVWKPFYGPGVILKEPDAALRIQDYGTAVEEALSEGPDAVVLVCDGSLWSRESALKAAKIVVKGSIPYGVVYNHMNLKDSAVLPKGGEAGRFFCAPHYENPFKPDKEAEKFYEALLKAVLQNGRPQKQKETGLQWIFKRWGRKKG